MPDASIEPPETTKPLNSWTPSGWPATQFTPLSFEAHPRPRRSERCGDIDDMENLTTTTLNGSADWTDESRKPALSEAASTLILHRGGAAVDGAAGRRLLGGFCDPTLGDDSREMVQVNRNARCESVPDFAGLVNNSKRYLGPLEPVSVLSSDQNREVSPKGSRESKGDSLRPASSWESLWYKVGPPCRAPETARAASLDVGGLSRSFALVNGRASSSVAPLNYKIVEFSELGYTSLPEGRNSLTRVDNSCGCESDAEGTVNGKWIPTTTSLHLPPRSRYSRSCSEVFDWPASFARNSLRKSDGEVESSPLSAPLLPIANGTPLCSVPGVSCFGSGITAAPIVGAFRGSLHGGSFRLPALPESPPVSPSNRLKAAPSIFPQLHTSLSVLGSGCMVAMAYVDPGNLESDLEAASQRSVEDPFLGYKLLWVLLWATVIGFTIQRISIDLGVYSGSDLASLCRRALPGWRSFVLWLCSEACLIGADLQAVVGCAVGLELVFGIPTVIGVLLTVVDTLLLFCVDFWGPRRLETCFAALLTLVAGCFCANMVMAKPSWVQVAGGLLRPRIPPQCLGLAVALIGSVVMPHNFFLQSGVVHSRIAGNLQSPPANLSGSPSRSTTGGPVPLGDWLDNRNPVARKPDKYLHLVSRIHTLEAFALLLITLLVNISVVSSIANVPLLTPGSPPLNLYSAHEAIKSTAGSGSALIWGLGLLAAGQSSTMASTCAGQFVMEGLLDIRIERLWIRLLTTRLSAIVPVLLIIYLGDKHKMEVVANAVNVMQALLLPFVLVLLLKFARSKEIMGTNTIGRPTEQAAIIGGTVLVVANIALIVSQLGYSGLAVSSVLLAAYFGLLLYIAVQPLVVAEPPIIRTTATSHSRTRSITCWERSGPHRETFLERPIGCASSTDATSASHIKSFDSV